MAEKWWIGLWIDRNIKHIVIDQKYSFKIYWKDKSSRFSSLHPYNFNLKKHIENNFYIYTSLLLKLQSYMLFFPRCLRGLMDHKRLILALNPVLAMGYRCKGKIIYCIHRSLHETRWMDDNCLSYIIKLFSIKIKKLQQKLS